MQAKVPTCTACFLVLSEHLVPLADGQFLLRFVNDSQSCVMWYLWLGREGESKVLASPFFFERDIFDALNDEENPIEYDEAFRHAMVCADSFPEFLYRFWIENTIWYLLRERLELNSRQGDYRSRITTRL